MYIFIGIIATRIVKSSIKIKIIKYKKYADYRADKVRILINQIETRKYS